MGKEYQTFRLKIYDRHEEEGQKERTSFPRSKPLINTQVLLIWIFVLCNRVYAVHAASSALLLTLYVRGYSMKRRNIASQLAIPTEACMGTLLNEQQLTAIEKSVRATSTYGIVKRIFLPSSYTDSFEPFQNRFFVHGVYSTSDHKLSCCCRRRCCWCSRCAVMQYASEARV